MTETDHDRRDYLAQERTELANERTFLAYVRTAVSLIVLGVAALHFMGDTVSQIFALFALGGGAIILLIGFRRFYGERSRIRK